MICLRNSWTRNLQNALYQVRTNLSRSMTYVLFRYILTLLSSTKQVTHLILIQRESKSHLDTNIQVV